MITTIDKFRLLLESKQSNTILIICDIQKEFDKYFNDDYLDAVNKYANKFRQVYQIWDEIDATEPSWHFPNEIECYAKCYGGELTREELDDYLIRNHESLFDAPTYDELNTKFNDLSFETGDKFKIKGHEDYYIYIGKQHDGGHEWFYCPSELSKLFQNIAKQNRECILIGGAGDKNGDHKNNGECLFDIYTCMVAFNINVEYDEQYLYTYNGSRYGQGGISSDYGLEDKENESIKY